MAGWGALRGYWYPVARSDQVTEAPVSARTLDEPLALWRGHDGEIHAFQDLCIHRGTPLSLGWREGNELVCSYHGWVYAADGSCARIPSLPTARGIPTKARVKAYRVRERYGLVWVCLTEPIAEIPPFPAEFEDPQWQWDTFSTETLSHANAARWVENLLDFTHHAWIHDGTLGDRRYPEIRPYEIRHLDDGFEFEIVDGGVVRQWSHASSPGPALRTRPGGRSRYRLVLPFAVFLTGYRDDSQVRLFRWWVCNPVSSKETHIYRFAGRNNDSPPADEAKRMAQLIYEQDRRIVEAQRPEELPLDLREELHLRGPDMAGLEYRRALKRIGVDWG